MFRSSLSALLLLPPPPPLDLRPRASAGAAAGMDMEEGLAASATPATAKGQKKKVLLRVAKRAGVGESSAIQDDNL